MDRKWSAVRPSPLLVRLLALTALATAAALPFPALVAPALTFAGVVILLAASDWAISRNDPAPQIERVLPTRLIKDRSATVVYRIRRAASGTTTISLLDELPGALGGDLPITDVWLGRGQLLQISREIVPARRGTFELGPTLVLWRSYLGLLGLRAGVTSKDAVAILPPASTPQRRAGLDHRSLREELGIKPRALRGEGREFESLREYVSGDDPRHIDWRASARHSHLQVRQYQTERRHTVFVALDTGRLMGAYVDGTSKLDHAINCAAALARASIGYGDRIGFVAFDNALRLFARPRSGLSGVGAMLDATSSLLPSSFEPDYRILVDPRWSWWQLRYRCSSSPPLLKVSFGSRLSRAPLDFWRRQSRSARSSATCGTSSGSRGSRSSPTSHGYSNESGVADGEISIQHRRGDLRWVEVQHLRTEASDTRQHCLAFRNQVLKRKPPVKPLA